MSKFTINYAPELSKFFIHLDGVVIYFNDAKQVGEQVELSTDLYIPECDRKESVFIAHVKGKCDDFHKQMTASYKAETAEWYQ